MRFVTHLLSALLLLSITTSTASALPLAESEPLHRMLLELDAMNPLIEEAQRQSDRQNRLRVNYRCLITDLNLLKQGLRAAVYAVNYPSRQFQSLCARYGFAGQIGGEAENLSLLMNELQSLTPILLEAKNRVNPSSRTRVNYPAFQHDLNMIISGIQNTLIGAGDQPRSFPALRGAFSQ